MGISSISIIVPTYNSGNILNKCILNIIKNTKNLKYELIIVDDASNDGSTDFLLKNNKFKISVYRLKKNRGVGYCRQYGAKKAKFGYLVYIDSDLIIKKNAISYLINSYEENKNVGSVGAIPSPINLNKKSFTSNFVFLRSIFGIYNLKKDTISSNIQSEFCLIKKSFLFDVGGWKSFKKSGGEEFELGFRIEKKKRKNYLCCKAKYITHYADIFLRFKKMIRRTSVYIPILLNKKKFETEGSSATSNYALSALITFLLLMSILLSFLPLEIKYDLKSLFIFLLLLQYYVDRMFMLFSWTFSKKVFIFSFFAIPMLNISIIIGFLSFLLKLKRRFL